MNAKTQAEVDRIWSEPLDEREFTRRLDLARKELEGEEYANLKALIDWFRRRYPTPRDRARYARRHQRRNRLARLP